MTVEKQNQQSGFSILEIGIVVVVVAVIGFLGWKFYDTKVNQSKVSNAAEKTETIDMVPEALSELADINTIRDDAIADKAGVTVVHIELEQSGDSLVYKAELSDGTVTVYNARTGARVRSLAAAEKTTEALPANLATGIGFARALEVARAEKPGGKVYKIELELEGGVVVYSVRFTDKARVDVNAQDGSIVRTKAARVETNSGKSVAEPAVTNNSGSSHSDSSHSGSEDDSVHNSTDDDLSDNDDDDSDDGMDDDHDDRSGSDDSDDSSNSGSGSGRH